MRIRRRRDELERQLDSERPQPPDELVSRLAERLATEPIRRRSGWSIALVAGLTTLLAVSLALTGGISYAAGAVKGGTTAVTSLVTGVSSTDNPGNSNGSSGKSKESSDKAGKATGNSDKSGDPNGSGQADNATSVAAGSASQADDKQAVCHVPPGNPENAHTIVVSTSAVPTHLDHGDSLGACPDDGGPPDDQYSEKVLICHIPPGKPENAHTISVSVNAVPAHLAHGDTEGPCPGN